VTTKADKTAENEVFYIFTIKEENHSRIYQEGGIGGGGGVSETEQEIGSVYQTIFK
jgi:hypothetical protein